MRKGINIKASVVFLSWLIFFAHALIPHYHSIVSDPVSASHSWCSPATGDHNDEHSGFICHCDEEATCSITAFLYHSNQDNEPYSTCAEGSHICFFQTGSRVIYTRSDQTVISVSSEMIFLRAPPIV